MGPKGIAIKCGTLNRAGDVAAAATDKGWVVFYDVKTQQRIAQQRVGTQRIHALIATQDGAHFVSAGEQQAVNVWKATNGQLVLF